MEAATFNCLYCDEEKTSDKSSLEHAIPQFMGGDRAPAQYMLNNVCESCNNKLGLFVDASFAKSWFVTNGLANAALRLYSGLNDTPLPLTCIGIPKIEGLSVPVDHVVENWVGPSGETIIWIRYDDERVYWYSGGNPTDKKRKPSTAYLFLTSADPTRWQMGIASFQAAFKAKKVRKILCVDIAGAPAGATLQGFDAPTAEEKVNITIIRNAIASGFKGQIRAYTKFDLRFISKIALAVGYSLFGESYLATSFAKEARKGCWPKEGDMSQLQGSSSLSSQPNPQFAQIVGYPGAVALMVMPLRSSYTLTVTVDQRMPFTVEFAPITLTSKWVDPDMGYVLLLFPQLGKVIELTLADMLAHVTGGIRHPELEIIDAKIRYAVAFQSKLGPVQ